MELKTTYTVYRLYDAERNLLYIGCTKDLRARLAVHSCQKEWWPEVATIETEEFDNRQDATSAELCQMQELGPRYNSTIRFRYPSEPAKGLGVNVSKLRELRVQAGLSQEALAHRAHMSYRTVFRLESGQSKTVRELTVRALAEALGVEPSEFLEG